jgi:hypothetical protein
MEATTLNPYRILGVLAGATNREIIKQANNLKRYLAAGVELPEDYSFAKIDDFQRTIENIDDAMRRNDTDQKKIENALFYFWCGNEIIDAPAFDALKEGDMKTAIEIWFNLIIATKEDDTKSWKTVTQKNASAFHNYFVANSMQNKLSIAALQAQMKFLESNFYSDFLIKVVDTTCNISKKELQLRFLNVLLAEKEIKIDKLAVNCFGNIDFEAKDDFLRIISKKNIEEITIQLNMADSACKASKAKAAIAGETLYNNTKDSLAQLKSIFGDQNFSYNNVADKVATKILECSIDFFVDSQEKKADNNFIDKALTLIEFAKNIACGNAVKDQIATTAEAINEIRTYYICFYCNRNIADSRSAYKKTLYKETRRDFLSGSVEYQYLEAITPRCTYCKAVHATSNWIMGLSITVFAAIGLLLGLRYWGYWFGCLLGGGVVGIIIGAIGKSTYSSAEEKKANVKKKSSFREFPPIKKLLDEGWSTNTPTA